MKKLLVAASIAMVAAFAQADCIWSTWFDSKADTDVSGCVLGLASQVKSIAGAQVDICINKAAEVKSGAQVSFGYNRATKLRNGCQVGFWNDAESAALQFGLLNFNKTGFLPFFPFFNFDTKMFGSR